MRKELELVLDIVRGKDSAVRHLANVLGAIDDLQVPGRIKNAGVAGVKIAACIDRLGRCIGPFVVFLQQHGTAHQDFAVVSDLHFSARCRNADGIEFDIAVRLQTNVGAGFSGPVQLLQVDADRPIETEQIRSDRRARRVRDANAAHPENVAERPVHQNVTEPVLEAIAPRYRLAVEDVGAAAPRDLREVMEQSALDRARVLHADHHLRQEILKDARRREVVRRPDFAHIGHHGVARLRTVDRESGVEPLRIRKQVIADPRHRQIRQHTVRRGKTIEIAAAFCRRDERRMALANALGFAGRPGCVQHDRHVVRFSFRDFLVKETGMREIELAAHFCDRVVARHAVVMAQSARIVVVDVRKCRNLRLCLEQLVDLLLIFGDRVDDSRIVQHIDKLGCRCILIHRNRDPAERIGCHHRPVQTRPVVTDDREMHPALEALGSEPAGECANLLRDFGPRPCLPDAEILFARRRMMGPHAGVLQQKPWKGVEPFLHDSLHDSFLIPRSRAIWRANSAIGKCRGPGHRRRR